jgi:hypothetical protein
MSKIVYYHNQWALKLDIPLPLKKQKNICLRGLRVFFYEAGARAYHLLQGRIL